MKTVFGILLCLIVSGLAPAFAKDPHAAITFWGLAHHENRDKGYNERNWGLGLRVYHGNWFAAADMMRNSVRGETRAIGLGYEQRVTYVRGYAISVAAEVAHVDYEFPGRGTIQGAIVIPFVSIRKGDWSGNIALVPPNKKREPIWLFSLTRHF